MNTQTFIDKLFHWAALGAWCLFILLFLNDVADAAEFEDPQRIEAAASQHASQQLAGGKVNAVARLPDSRLRLARCDSALDTQSMGQSQGQRQQVMVSCPGQWKIYVPVSIEQQLQLVIAKRSLQHGEVVSADDLSLQWREIKGSGYGHFEQIEAVVGRRVARPLRAGQIVTPGALRQNFAVHKGDTVTLLSRAGAVEIRGRGQAQENAVENTRLKVRNLSSGRIVEGYVRGDGIVEIQG